MPMNFLTQTKNQLSAVGFSVYDGFCDGAGNVQKGKLLAYVNVGREKLSECWVSLNGKNTRVYEKVVEARLYSDECGIKALDGAVGSLLSSLCYTGDIYGVKCEVSEPKNDALTGRIIRTLKICANETAEEV